MASQGDRSSREIIDYYDSDTDTEPEILKDNELGYINITQAVHSKRLIFKRKHPEHSDCPICYTDMFSKVVAYTPCGHTICRTCVVNQIDRASHQSYKYNCPICRTDLKRNFRSIESYNIHQTYLMGI